MKYRKKRRTKSISISSKRRRRSSGGERKERRITLENGSIFIAPIWRREHDQTGISRSALPGETKTMKRNSISTVQRFHRTHRNNQVPTRQAGDREREERKHFFSLHRDQHCDQCNKQCCNYDEKGEKSDNLREAKGNGPRYKRCCWRHPREIRLRFTPPSSTRTVPTIASRY